jgi:MSHA pilin protein MshC
MCCAYHASPPKYHAAGFTLVELVVVLVLAGIIAAVAAPRLSGTRVADEIAFAQDTRGALRYAQKTAIAQRRMVCVAFSATSVSFTVAPNFGGACSSALIGPGGENPYTVTTTSSGFGSVPANFSFDALGVPSIGQTITVAGVNITIEAGTGYVR